MLENCHMYALKWFWNAYTWHELEDLLFCGPWISLHDQPQNGPKPVTNAWIEWFLMFITHVNSNNIVMWVTLHNNADWDCFKTLILQEILKIQIHFWRNIVRFFGSHTFVPISWKCKKQTSVSRSFCRTVWRFTHGRYSSSRSLGFGHRKCFILVQTNPTTKIKYEETRRVTPHQTSTLKTTKVPTQHDNFDLSNVDCVPSNNKFSRFGAML